MPLHNDINRIQTPVDIATKMFLDQQEGLLQNLLGPQQRQRVEVPRPDEAVIISQQDVLEDMIGLTGNGAT